ncbi:MAG: hypothetical protein QXG65_06400 [Thermoplasmata archaeon]
MVYGLLGVAVTVVVVVIVVLVIWGISSRLNRRTGNRGVAQLSRLTCPHCGKTFDYEWIPGASLTAVRLGSSRYMACPLCHKWSTFNVVDTLVPRDPDPARAP